MTHARRMPASLDLDRRIPPGFADALAVAAESVVELQCAQLNTLLAWQRSLAAIHQEMWDVWLFHWAGGAPIDA